MQNTESLASLRKTLAHIEGGAPCAAGFVPLGVPRLDARLGGGLAKGALHEIFAAESGDASAAAAFALLLAGRGRRSGKPLIWVREDRGRREAGRLYAPGLAEIGVDPNDLIVVHASECLSALRAAADIVRCSAVGGLVIEAWGKAAAFDLTASRRLSLAAANSGVMAMALRIEAAPAPSAAATRWLVKSAASNPLEANAPGGAAFDISLLRHRGGIAGLEARVEWDRERNSFREAALPRGVPAVPVVGTVQIGERRAA